MPSQKLASFKTLPIGGARLSEMAGFEVTTNVLVRAPAVETHQDRMEAIRYLKMSELQEHKKELMRKVEQVDRLRRPTLGMSVALRVALKRPVRSFGAMTDSKASSFTDGSARV